MNAMTRAITTQEVAVETVTVEIRAMTLNGKQMTLSVFRQLPKSDETELEEIGEAEVVDGQPWGIVRYAIKDEGDIWLVFSRAGKLYRRALDFEEDPFLELRTSLRELREDVRILENSGYDKETGNQTLQNKRRALAYEEKALKDYLAEERERIGRETNYLDTLPQLFIAV